MNPDRRTFLSWLAESFAAGSMLSQHWRGFFAKPVLCETGGDPIDADVAPIKGQVDDLPRLAIHYPYEEDDADAVLTRRVATSILEQAVQYEREKVGRGVAYGEQVCRMQNELRQRRGLSQDWMLKVVRRAEAH